MYPNPSLGEFQLSFSLDKPESEKLSWEIIDITGKKVKEGNISNFTGETIQSFDLKQQGAGTYLMRLMYNKKVYTERIIVK